MRRPAQHPLPGIRSTWVHPYTGLTGLAVFYNDGGDPPAAPPVPKPAPPAGPAPQFTQEDLDRIAAREKAQGKRSALKDFAEEHGFSSFEDAAAFIAEARKAREAQLSEQEKREQELAERERKAAELIARAEAKERAANRRAVLVGLGATGDDLEDAAALLRVADDADDATVQDAAAKLKERRPELFGTARPQPTPQTLPPAPGGAPAGGPPKAPASKDDVKARARALAEKMGYAKPAA